MVARKDPLSFSFVLVQVGTDVALMITVVKDVLFPKQLPTEASPLPASKVSNKEQFQNAAPPMVVIEGI